MHEIIQILFDWDGYHMHDFRIPSDDILIEQDTGEDNFWNYGGYKENKPLLEKITSKMQKDTYRRIKKFSENMEAMLRV